MDWYPAAILILVTGLPAAGKSTFLDAAQRYALGHGTHSPPLLGGDGRGRVAAVLQIDDVLQRTVPQQDETGDPSARDDVARCTFEEALFSPARWKCATQRLLQFTENVLHACVSEAYVAAGSLATPHALVPLIFVEDNMHLRSMRERYYRLCRRVEDEWVQRFEKQQGRSSQGPFIGMLELRFIVPLSVCMERNARRLQSSRYGDAKKKAGCAAVTAVYVPPPVIESMHAVFERCLEPDSVAVPAAAAQTAGEESDDTSDDGTPSKRWWRWAPTTQPWSLLELVFTDVTFIPGASERLEQDADLHLPTAEELAVEFFTVTLQDATRRACQTQYARVLQRREQRRQTEAVNALTSRQGRAARMQMHTHDLDLQLRAVAHRFLAEGQHVTPAVAAGASSRNTPEFGKAVSKLKKQALQWFKEECRKPESVWHQRQHQRPLQDATRNAEKEDEEEQDAEEERMAALHEAYLMAYQQSLASLWNQRDAE